MSYAWTDDRVAMLQKLKADGLTFHEIARRLGGGLTRNAVSGKLHRLAGYKHPGRGEHREARGRGREPREDYVLAAAIMFDGGTTAEAMEETGLDAEGVYRAVRAARIREYRDARREKRKPERMTVPEWDENKPARGRALRSAPAPKPKPTPTDPCALAAEAYLNAAKDAEARRAAWRQTG